MKRKNILVTLADKNHIDAAKQLFSSAYFKGGWDGDMMLLAHEDENRKFTEEELHEFKEKDIFVKRCKPLYDKYIGKFSPIVLSKFYLFKKYFKRWDNVVFLDADIIVNGDIRGLANVHGFNAVESPPEKELYQQFLKWGTRTKDVIGQLKKRFPKENKELQRYNLFRAGFNLGVLALDTNTIKEYTFDKLYSMFKKYKSIIRIPDEAICNLYFYKKWKKLPFVYNHTGKYVFSMERRDIKKAIILHFMGDKKPWKENNVMHDIWNENLERFDEIGKEKPYAKKWSKLKILSNSIIIYFQRSVYLIRLRNKKIDKTIKRSDEAIQRYVDIIRDNAKKIKNKINQRKIYGKIIDKNLGKIGIFLKKNTPDLYKILKR